MAIIHVHAPLRLDEASEAAPDLVLAEPLHDCFAHSDPAAANTLLLAELTDSTPELERVVWMPLDAQGQLKRPLQGAKSFARLCLLPRVIKYLQLQLKIRPGLLRLRNHAIRHPSTRHTRRFRDLNRIIYGTGEMDWSASANTDLVHVNAQLVSLGTCSPGHQEAVACPYNRSKILLVFRNPGVCSPLFRKVNLSFLHDRA